ncbi:SCO6745 family protein [Actinomadura nitritigenes]|uniref:SCO6745 family protein n=1 Tax=Actinomadura nitritigenes TaxID=134602 RepID=UPI003D8FBAAF
MKLYPNLDSDKFATGELRRRAVNGEREVAEMTMTHDLSTIRQMWQLLEPVHAVLYYAPEASEEAAALGYAVDERWPSYFPYRAAPLGAVDAQTVSELFYSFNPEMVEQYMAPAWQAATPEQVLAARRTAMDRVLRRILGDRIGSPELQRAAQMVRRVAEAADVTDRPMAAANAALPWPDEPHMVLWQAATILREHRGDGHIAALRAHDIGPAEALVSHAAVGAAPAEVFASRQWTAEQWNAARDRLAARGLVRMDPEGAGQAGEKVGELGATRRVGDVGATEEGVQVRAAIEKRTDELAAGPWDLLSSGEVKELADLLMPVVLDIVGTGLLPMQSTLGIGMTYDYGKLEKGQSM